MELLTSGLLRPSSSSAQRAATCSASRSISRASRRPSTQARTRPPRTRHRRFQERREGNPRRDRHRRTRHRRRGVEHINYDMPKDIESYTIASDVPDAPDSKGIATTFVTERVLKPGCSSTSARCCATASSRCRPNSRATPPRRTPRRGRRTPSGTGPGLPARVTSEQLLHSRGKGLPVRRSQGGLVFVFLLFSSPTTLGVCAAFRIGGKSMLHAELAEDNSASIPVHDYDGNILTDSSPFLKQCRVAMAKRLTRPETMPPLNIDPLRPLPLADAAPGGPAVKMVYFILASRKYAHETINRNVNALQRPGALMAAGSNDSNLFLLHVDAKMSAEDNEHLRSRVTRRPDVYFIRRPRPSCGPGGAWSSPCSTRWRRWCTASWASST